MVMPSRVRHNSRPRVALLYLIPPPPLQKKIYGMAQCDISQFALIVVG